MPGSRTPLIRREEVFEVALDMHDNHGIDGVSTRAIADALNVKASSLYHHFAGKKKL